MPVYVGSTNWWWRDSTDSPADCQAKSLARTCGKNGEGTVLNDGSFVICVGAGAAWIMAPASTQVSDYWAGGQYNSTNVSSMPSVSCWPALETALTNAGLNPTDWFVPSYTQLQNPGYVCRDNWDFFVRGYWSSTKCNDTLAEALCYNSGSRCTRSKTTPLCVRAMRCVNY